MTTPVPTTIPATKYALPPWVRDLLVGLCTAAVLASVTLVLRLDKTVATFVKTHVEAHKQLDAVVVELKTSTIANAREVNAIRDDFIEFSARTGAERYTVHSAFEDQKKQADELKAVWDSIHAIKLDIVKLQSVTKHE